MILKVIVGGVVVFLAVWAWKIHIYLKRQKRKERDEAPFHRWADEVHQRPGQKEKLHQAKEEDISVHFESEKKCFARMKFFFLARSLVDFIGPPVKRRFVAFLSLLAF